jgi:hypothetical protein
MTQTKTKPKPKARKKPRPKKSPALKQFLEMVKAGRFKFPRKLRQAVQREMNDEGRKIQKKVGSFYTKVMTPGYADNPFESMAKLPRHKSRLVELFDAEMKPRNFDMPDLMNPRKTHPGKLSQLIWLEKGLVAIPEVPANGDAPAKPAELRETEWRPTPVKLTEVAEYMKKGEAFRAELRESNIEPDVNYQGNVPVEGMSYGGKYFPYPPSSFTRQLYIPDQWYMLARAAHCYNYNPLAKAAVDIKTSFIVGNGPTVIINNNDQLDKLVKDFFKTEDFVETLRTWCSMLGINGELFVEFYRNQIGNPTVHSVDPGHVYEIITQPRDIRQVLGLKLMYQTQMQIFGTGARGETVPLSEWIYETIPPDNIMHIKVNVQENEKRGRSDLLSCLAVLQLFEDYIRYKVLRSIVEAAFVWDVKMTGADQDQIDSFLTNDEAAMPPPGSTRAHNETIEWKPLANQTGGSGKDEVFEMLLTIVAVSTNLPKEYLGASSSGSRANAITSTEPSVKAFQARRRKLESLIMRIIDYLATSNAITYDPEQVEVSWEEIAPEDVNKKIDRLYTELDRNTFTKKRVDEMIAKLEGVTNYGWDKEMQNRLVEITTGITKSLEDGSPTGSTAGMGMDQPEAGKPVVAPTPAPVGASATGPGPAGSSGIPSSLSADDRTAAHLHGEHL